MSCEHLICAQCAGPVAEARCPACREARAEVHRHVGGYSLPVITALLLAALLIMLTVRLAH